MVKLESNFTLTNDTPYLALTGAIWDVFVSSSMKNYLDIQERTVLDVWHQSMAKY